MLVHSSWPERCLCRCNGGCAVRLCQTIWWSFSGNLHGWEASTVICKRQEESSISGWAYWIWGQWIHSEWHCKYLYVYRTTQWMAYCRCTGTSYPGRLGEADKVALLVLAQRTDYFSYIISHYTMHFLLAIFRNKYDMVLAFPSAMC